MTGSAKGKVVAITGASSGIGEAVACLLGAAGAKVVLGARRTERLAAVASRIKAAGGNAATRPLDVTDRASMAAFVDAAVAEFGRLDVFVSNAGVMLLGHLAEGKVNEWERMVDVNVKGVLFGLAAALPVMRSQGSGHLINVASVAGHRVTPGAAVYCSTKFAVRALAEGFRQEAGPNIRSTIVSPGVVLTELPDHVTDSRMAEASRAAYAIAIPADAVARAILFAIEQPADVDVNEIIVRPTAQQS